MNTLHYRMEFAALAHRRYPDVELPLAVEFLRSDRRRAGLGALKDGYGGEVEGVFNRKRQDLLSGRVIYDLVRVTPPRKVFEEAPLWGLAGPNPMSETFSFVVKPGQRQHLCVAVEGKELRDQLGRHAAAKMLRQARRMLRNGEGRVEES